MAEVNKGLVIGNMRYEEPPRNQEMHPGAVHPYKLLHMLVINQTRLLLDAGYSEDAEDLLQEAVRLGMVSEVVDATVEIGTHEEEKPDTLQLKYPLTKLQGEYFEPSE